MSLTDMDVRCQKTARSIPNLYVVNNKHITGQHLVNTTSTPDLHWPIAAPGHTYCSPYLVNMFLMSPR